MRYFVHLHTHTHYSLLDGLSKIDDLIALARAGSMPALAITDHGNLYGALEFYKKCRKAGIKPIIGVEAYIAERTRFDKEPSVDNRRYHVTLLAKNFTGYKNLIKLVTKAHLEGYYYKPRMDHDLLQEFHEGILCLSGCFGSELGRALRNKNHDKATAVARKYQEIFGKDNYFFEIMHHPGIEDHERVRKEIIGLSRELRIPLVGTYDSHYAHAGDKEAHETLLAVQTGNDSGEAKFTFGEEDFSFINSETAHRYFHETPQAIENTLRIAEMCDLELKLGAWVFPNFKIPKNTTYDDELRKLTYQGLARRNFKETDEVRHRIEKELGVIRTKGYSPYFLVVADLIRFARENQIYTTTRGSVAGSIVAYFTGITNVDPLRYRLPFERFLNIERPSPPDIDMDFADNRRDEVIEYARNKYGETSVAQIGTFGTMLARGSVRDVARALGHSYETGDTIARLIPIGSQGFPMTIKRAMDETPELKEMYEKDEDAKKIITTAKKLEGCVRHISVHAAGVVIAPGPLTHYVPLQLDPKGGKLITQWDMHAVEDAGLLKLDFLGIRNLSILGDAVNRVKKNYETDIDIENIPLDDKETFAMLSRGETMGLFQLNGAGMTRYLKELKPTAIDDINAMVALYRPGPLAFIPEYIERKKNPSKITYLDQELETILKFTYGIITYQDDVLEIAVKLSGYSWGEADQFRKAIGKKIPKEMQAQRERFFRGCLQNGFEKEMVQKLWNMIETFAAYGFNKAHAASYGKVAYQTAYMKANYPTEYMASVLTADSGDIEKIAEIITECARMKIPVLPPDINESFGKFTILKNKSGDKIRFGLHSIKNVGEEIADFFIKEREESGKFVSFANFLERVHHRNLNRKSLEALIKCGAMDFFGDRGHLYANIEEALSYNKEHAVGAESQNSLFKLMEDQSSIPTLRLKESEKAEFGTKLAWEKELLGLYISGHPLEKHRKQLEKTGTPIEKIKTYRDGIRTIFGCIVEEAKLIMTSNGERMAFVKLSDFTDSIEAVVFPRAYREYKEMLEPEKNVFIRGKISYRNGTPNIIVEKVKEL